MAVLRRLIAFATLLVTLLLVLTEAGFACADASMQDMAGSASAAGMDDMPGMSRSGAPRNAAHDPAPAQGPCRFPWAPSGCRDMAPCSPAALTVAAAMPPDPAPATEAIIVARVTAPVSVEMPPEPPPPRA
jgi:hypothetical protein